jgi:ElaB/YqjD/DUF883 family membrane-anchored ribosome-binding protein
MSKETQAISNDMRQLAEDARALMSATAEVAGEKASDARTRLAAALDRSKQVYGRVRERAADSAKAADQAVRRHPYQTTALALAAGALLGFLVSMRCSRKRD